MLHSPRLFLNQRRLRTLTAGLVKRYAALFRGRYLVEQRMGLWLLLDQQNAVDRHLLFRGFWEQDRVDYLTHLVSTVRLDSRPRLFLDIGAHAALYSLLMQKTGAFERLVAFEPAPANLIQLRANLLLNHCVDQIEVSEKAASDLVGTTEFLVECDRNRGMSRFMPSSQAVTDKCIRVATTTIDAEIPVTDHVVVVKIDVEGAELSVIKGMEATLQNNALIMQVERNTGPVEDLVALLDRNGMNYLRSLGPDHYFISRSLCA